ncbi:MAG: hypothetical protein N0C84_01375 [Candidatus Thiodiazotropha taylori]|uniref:Uncharacterized protein n=1 Tax=Candidatus Thiodiazotropha taylori TaxID=2792791 RepID=A0A9E4N2S6_9GAMM|nr:hypothetical protein [Candidatus Thiodiazotropha taylori]MCW4255098.1 hypothetical protein [Candidatus Thiodiazotropha taylori]
MAQINDILKHFENIREFTEFVDAIKEAADGEEIARGMNPNDSSKEQKAGTGEGEENQEKSAPPEGGDAVEAEGAETPEGPTIDPVAAPGSQISIGKKVESKIHEKPKTKALDVKGSEKVKVDTTPSITVDHRHM